MRKTLVVAAICGLLVVALALPALAQDKTPARKGFVGFSCEPPRFQVFEAPNPYGGLIMLDTKTGASWQRIIVNSPQGIQIRWMPLERGGPNQGEAIIWQ
jgi:hypothetical protein